MGMPKVLFLFILMIGCNGFIWEAIHNFKVTFQEYKEASERTLFTLEAVLNSSKYESNKFLDSIYENNQILSELKESNLSETCSRKLLGKDNLTKSFKIQVFLLQAPLQNRIIDIRERLRSISEKIDMYQSLSDNRYSLCWAAHENCVEETNHWLEPIIRDLSCSLSSNCSKPIAGARKRRSVCGSGFMCSGGNCVRESDFCDGRCDCNHCSDEPPGCVRNCEEFRCEETFRCVSLELKCDGKDDCGDGSDEKGCPPLECDLDSGGFRCGTGKCVPLERVCDGKVDCHDGTDEGPECSAQCSARCREVGGFCLGARCLFECPPGTFETPEGCKLRPQAPPGTLAQAVEDTPRLLDRYSARLGYLKSKTIMEVSKSLREVVKCNKGEYILLSRVIKFSSKNDQFDMLPRRNLTNDQDKNSTLGITSDTHMPMSRNDSGID